MKKTDVYFIPLTNDTPAAEADARLKHLFESAGLPLCIQENDLVAIKMHFGETGNRNVVAPRFVRSIVNGVKAARGEPFLTDTCVLYKSERADAVSYLKLIHKQGYTLEATGAPALIADGLLGSHEIEIPIPGELFSSVAIATDAVMAHAMLVLTHVTGHIGAGLGAALKNLGMGLASRKGKLRQHSGIKPQISAKQCTACGQCIQWCPKNAISLVENIAVINSSLCIGCGQCLAVCRFSAVTHNWAVDAVELQKRIAEHALGAVIRKREKTGYLNFLTAITRNCDCMGVSQKPLLPDIGVIAARDPVAIDQASIDLIQKFAGRPLSQMAYPQIDYLVQLNHAEKIGLGQRAYNLVTLA
jgi:uncharacterized Fe-S center protein